jgi:non-ribosomal peptide synthetase component F
VQFATRQVEGAAPELEHITVSPLRRDELRVRFDLEVLVSVSGDQLALDWRFQRSLFDHWRIEQMLRHYMSILDAVTVEEAECAL